MFAVRADASERLGWAVLSSILPDAKLSPGPGPPPYPLTGKTRDGAFESPPLAPAGPDSDAYSDIQHDPFKLHPASDRSMRSESAGQHRDRPAEGRASHSASESRSGLSVTQSTRAESARKAGLGLRGA